ncbi:MAG: serine/threonine-protein kinase, partial [Gemmataceae bacterium]
MESMFRAVDGVEEQFPEQVLASKGRRRRVGPYVLLERLGGGGMGHVYKAQHRLMKRMVAVKLLGRLRRGGDDGAVLNRFRREVEAAGRLRHPSIVTAFDAGAWRGRLYLAMEYIEGIDLERFVEDTGPLSVDLACEIVRQTAEALHHAHERGIVHRDIKPSNLMLAPPGVTVKLLDLGLAQLTRVPSSRIDEEQ